MTDRAAMLDDFVEDVADMRLWQSRFHGSAFGTEERRSAYHRARALERKVDDGVKRLRALRDHVPPPPEDRLI